MKRADAVHTTPMVWDGGRWTPIQSETFPAVPSTYLFSSFGLEKENEK